MRSTYAESVRESASRLTLYLRQKIVILCLDISQINYNLGTTYATNNNYCQDVLFIISNISILFGKLEIKKI